MIKKWLTYLTVSILSVLFSYAACGYNLAKYCCSICEDEGIEAIMDEPCHKSDANTCCINHHDEDADGLHTNNCNNNYCQLIHLKVDDSVFSSETKKLSNTPVVYSILYANNALLVDSSVDLLSNALIPPDNPTYKTGRAVLNSNCILRI